jgi:hypothetical protein
MAMVAVYFLIGMGFLAAGDIDHGRVFLSSSV